MKVKIKANEAYAEVKTLDGTQVTGVQAVTIHLVPNRPPVATIRASLMSADIEADARIISCCPHCNSRLDLRCPNCGSERLNDVTEHNSERRGLVCLACGCLHERERIKTGDDNV